MRYEFGLKQVLARQLRFRDNGRAERNVPNDQLRIFAPLLETSHYRFYHYLIVAKALELRGARVKVLLCGSQLDGCELKSVLSPKRDPCLECRMNKSTVVPHFGIETQLLAETVSPAEIARLRDIARSVCEDWPTSYVYREVEIMLIVGDSVTRHFYGAVPAEGSADLARVRQAHVFSTLLSIEAAHTVERQWHPQVVLSYMTAYSAWGPYYKYFKQRGTPVINISSTQFNYRAVNVNAMDLYLSDDRFTRYVASRRHAELTREESAKLDGFIAARFSGKAPTLSAFSFFDPDSSKLGNLRIDPGKRNIFLFSNVWWDIGMSDLDQLFPKVIDWVIATIEMMAGRFDCHLYIKTHPGETYDAAPSLKGVAHYIAERFSTLPDNVTIIHPGMRISPYELMPHANAAVVFNGTLGIEMMLGGVPVVACGAAPYTGQGLATQPHSLEHYRDLLVGDSELAKPDPSRVRLFAYFYFIKHQLPWTLTEQVFGHNFDGFTVESLDDLLPGKDSYLDHLCNCVMRPEDTLVEGW